MKTQIDLFYDDQRAQSNLDNNFEPLGTNTNLYFYTNNGNNVFRETKLIVLHVDECRLTNVMEEAFGCDYYEYGIESLCDELLDLFDFDLSQMEAFLKKNKIDFTPNFSHFETRGYSQGDYAEVIVPGILDEKQREALQQKIDNYFWDSPIELLATIEIFNKSYTISSFEIDDFPEYLNYSCDIEKVKNIFLDYVKKDFASMPIVLPNLLKLIDEEFPTEVTP